LVPWEEWKWMIGSGNTTVDGRNPAPPKGWLKAYK